MNNQPNLEYIDDFEIIDQKFASFLNRKFGDKLLMTPACYSVIKNKILMIIKLDQTYGLEIVSLNPQDHTIIVDYLIEIQKIYVNISSELLINTIIKFIQDNDIQNIRNPININNSIILIFHPINEKLRNSLQNMENNPSNKDIKNNSQTPIITGVVDNKVNNENTKTEEIFKEQYIISKDLFQLITSYINVAHLPVYKEQIFNIRNIASNSKDLENYKIKYDTITGNNTVFYYPKDFNKIEKIEYNNFLNFLQNPAYLPLFEEIYVIQINGGFFFIPKENNSVTNNNNLIYLYSHISNGQNQSIEPNAFIICRNNVERNANFNKIPTIQNYINAIGNPNDFANKLNSSCILLNDLIVPNPTVPNPNIKTTPLITNQNINPALNTTIKPTPIITKPEIIESAISDKLKVLILFAISQQHKSTNKFEKVHLFSRKWFNDLEFKKIQDLVNDRINEIFKLWNKTYDLNSLSSIIPILDNEKLKKLDSKLKYNQNNPWHAEPESVLLVDKYILLYRKFILVNDSIFNLIQHSFGIRPINDDISYILNNQREFIVFKNQKTNPQNPNQVQNLILYGWIDRKDNKIKDFLIFDYPNIRVLENELIIISPNIGNYINSRTCLNFQNKKDFFSPIFDDNNQIIGNVYRFEKKHDYSQYKMMTWDL